MLQHILQVILHQALIYHLYSCLAIRKFMPYGLLTKRNIPHKGQAHNSCDLIYPVLGEKEAVEEDVWRIWKKVCMGWGWGGGQVDMPSVCHSGTLVVATLGPFLSSLGIVMSTFAPQELPDSLYMYEMWVLNKCWRLLLQWHPYYNFYIIPYDMG